MPQFTPEQQAVLDSLDNDPIMNDLKAKLEALKPEMAELLAQAVKRSLELADPKIQKYLSYYVITFMMMNGFKADLSSKVMDILDPGWENKTDETIDLLYNMIANEFPNPAGFPDLNSFNGTKH